jgi:hypothetical protein
VSLLGYIPDSVGKLKRRSEFRDRLIKWQAEGRVFEKLADQIREKGLIKEHGKQRTDSLAMLTKVRGLCRVETVVETLRLAIVETDREWSEEILPPSWGHSSSFSNRRHKQQVICPKGHVAKHPSPVNNGLSSAIPVMI